MCMARKRGNEGWFVFFSPWEEKRKEGKGEGKPRSAIDRWEKKAGAKTKDERGPVNHEEAVYGS